jgi:hypothetical protein
MPAPQERWYKTHLQLNKTARKTRGRSDSSGLESFLIVNVPAKGAQDRLKMNSVLFLSLVFNSLHRRGARQGGVVFCQG